jgi:FkbM family methyltransferase
MRHPPLSFIVRSAMDIWSIKETFFDQFYTRYGVPIQNGWVVMDIGAGIGDYAIYAAYENEGVVVYAYEPFPESFELLLGNLTLNSIESVHIFRMAVWGHTGTLRLDFSAGEPLQISSREPSEDGQAGDAFYVDAITLADAIDNSHIDKVDLLKMDCEGGEYEILLTAPAETLARIDRIIMEYHELDLDHTHTKLVGFLIRQGYRVKRYPNIVHKDIGYLFAMRG